MHDKSAAQRNAVCDAFAELIRFLFCPDSVISSSIVMELAIRFGAHAPPGSPLLIANGRDSLLSLSHLKSSLSDLKSWFSGPDAPPAVRLLCSRACLGQRCHGHSIATFLVPR